MLKRRILSIRIIILIILTCIMFPWVISIGKCEILTAIHKNEFINFAEINYNKKLKILDYSDNFARIYCVGNVDGDNRSYNFGNVYTFRKEDSNWIFNEWENTVWSDAGSADGFIWPYIR